MARTARTLIDVILGEATRGSRAERFNDMVGIISTVANRAAMTGKPWDDIIANRSQFNAYGKRLPSGVEQFRDLAERAIAFVQQNGPVHQATYFATPAAVPNLRKGARNADLQEIGKTRGHVYFEDRNFAPIVTASGTARMDPAKLPAAQNASTDNRQGMARLVPENYGQQTVSGGNISFRHPWQSELQEPLTNALMGASQALGQDLTITSGHRPADYNRRVGGARQSYHIGGRAADIDMSGMDNRQRQALIANLAQSGVGGIGAYSNSPNMLHVDMRPRPDGAGPHFMYDRTIRNMDNAPSWFQQAARGQYAPQQTAQTLPSQGPVPRQQYQLPSQAPVPMQASYQPGPQGGDTAQAFAQVAQNASPAPQPQQGGGGSGNNIWNTPEPVRGYAPERERSAGEQAIERFAPIEPTRLPEIQVTPDDQQLPGQAPIPSPRPNENDASVSRSNQNVSTMELPSGQQVRSFLNDRYGVTTQIVGNDGAGGPTLLEQAFAFDPDGSAYAVPFQEALSLQSQGIPTSLGPARPGQQEAAGGPARAPQSDMRGPGLIGEFQDMLQNIGQTFGGLGGLGGFPAAPTGGQGFAPGFSNLSMPAMQAISPRAASDISQGIAGLF